MILELLQRPFRAQARWIAARFDGEAQMALGSACLDLGVVMFVVLPWSGEPPLIYSMSAFALVYGGLGLIASGQALLEVEHTQEGSP